MSHLTFFFVGGLSTFINSKNDRSFGLQPYGIISIAEYGTFYIDKFLEPNKEKFLSNSTWDIFEHAGHVYLSKPPGQFLIGALVYFVLKKFGVVSVANVSYTCGLIALSTSVIMTSLMGIMMFNIAFKITRRFSFSLLVSTFFVFGTLMFPYSTVIHHDIYATFFLFFSFYLLFYRNHISKGKADYLVLIAGFFTGFALFCSYNSVFTMLIVCLYVIFSRRLKDILLFSITLLFALSLSFIFNFVAFGNLLDFPITLYTKLYDFSHEFHVQDYLQNTYKKLDQFLFSPITAITFYSPIFLVSYVGLFFLPLKYQLEKKILILAFIFQILQPHMHATLIGPGWCQYGPRYLIEATPFTLIGLSSFFTKEKIPFDFSKDLNFVIYLLGIVSIIVCAVGTKGIVYCGYHENAFLNYMRKINSGEIPHFLFPEFGISLLILSVSLFLFKYPRWIARRIKYCNRG